jgi:peptidoglycan-associated lipoprotein
MFMLNQRKITIVCMGLSLAVFAAGCKKKAPVPPPPPPPVAETKPTVPPPPPAPIVSQFSAEPSSIQRGQSSTLRWEVAGNVTNVSINQGVGTVQSAGSRSVSPSSSTTYTLTAAGPGGSTTSSATVNVTEPPPPAVTPPAVKPRESLDEVVSRSLQDAYFDYDKSDVRGDARDVLTRNAVAIKSILADFPNAVIVVEGHCDERGSAEYNLGLGDRRATAAKEFLVGLGVPADKLRGISYGKERPQCTSADESCYQRNRRAHFSSGQ